MASYSRNCRYCGRGINLRKMPHGQWVPFEGSEQHKCQSAPANRTTTQKPLNLSQQSQSPRNAWGADLDFGEDFTVNNSQPKGKESANPSTPYKPHASQPHSTNISPHSSTTTNNTTASQGGPFPGSPSGTRLSVSSKPSSQQDPDRPRWTPTPDYSSLNSTAEKSNARVLVFWLLVVIVILAFWIF